jgi:hypothetical protein
LGADYFAPAMTIDFTCQKCEASFELDAQDLIDGDAKLACSNCNAKAPSAMVEEFVSALSEMQAQVAALSKKFAVNMSLESEELDDELESDDEDEDEDEDDEESDDDELDFDEDEDDSDEPLEDEDR